MSAPRFGEEGFLHAWGAAWSADVDALLTMCADDVVYTDVGAGTTFRGADELRGFHAFMEKFSPGGLIEFHEAHGDRDGFAATWTWSGTQKGPIRIAGVQYPATGRTFSVPGVAFCTLAADGRIATHRDYWDVLDVLRQLDIADEGEEFA
jgi:steroid delta-isomerase-like uncharacterized protein